MSTTPILEMEELDAAQSQPELKVNAALRRLEVFGQICAISQVDPSDSPFLPADGDVYLVPADTLVDDWIGHENQVAYYAAGWQFLAPKTGWIAYVEDDAGFFKFEADSPAAWVLFTVSAGAFDAFDVEYASASSPASGVSPETVGDALDELFSSLESLDDLRISTQLSALRSTVIGVSISDKPAAAAIYHLMIPIPIRLPASLTGSYTYSGTNATSTATFTLKRNGVSIGTLAFGSGSSSASATFSAAIDFAAGDRLTIEAPGSQDATLANVSISLKATRI